MPLNMPWTPSRLSRVPPTLNRAMVRCKIFASLVCQPCIPIRRSIKDASPQRRKDRKGGAETSSTVVVPRFRSLRHLCGLCASAVRPPASGNKSALTPPASRNKSALTQSTQHPIPTAIVSLVAFEPRAMVFSDQAN